MPLAINLRLDTATTARIDAMTEALPDRRPNVRHQHSEYPSHLALARCDDAVDIALLDAALATVAARWKKLPVTLAAFGIFPGTASTIWLAPVPSIDLLGRHRRLHRVLGNLTCHPHYEVGTWVPHVTVAGTTLLPDAVEVMASMWTGPMSGTLESLDLVRFDPVEVLSSRPLRG